MEDTSFSENDDEMGFHRRFWIGTLFLAFALFLHLLFLKLPVHLESKIVNPSPMDVEVVSPKKLESIRNQWKEKSLLLNPSKTKPLEKENTPPPPNARYFSNQNIRVEREQRAQKTEILPKKGKGRSVQLKSLGIPFSLIAPNSTQKSTIKSPPSKPAKSANDEVRKSQNEPAGERGEEGSETLGQALLEPNLPVGYENLLNTQESVYYSFYARMYESVGPDWRRLIRNIVNREQPLIPGTYVTVLEVILNESGDLREIKILSSSGVDAYDDIAIQAWQRNSRFPNPPKGLIDLKGNIHTSWTFQLRLGR